MRLLIVFLLSLLPALAWAQHQALRFERIGTSKGLSQSSVSSILQDREGFMWFATRDGLNKYDGYKFTIYKTNPRDSLSISNNNVRYITEDKKGNFWIATWGGGINFFNKEKGDFYHYKNSEEDTASLSNNFVHIIYEDIEGKKWVGTDAGGAVFPLSTARRQDGDR